MNQEQTYTTDVAASYLGLSKRYLEKLRLTGNGPIFIKIGRSVRYRQSDLNAFLERHAIGSTSESTATGNRQDRGGAETLSGRDQL